MFRNWRAKARVQLVEFCDACGTVCDASCRAERHYEEMKTRAIAARTWPLA